VGAIALTVLFGGSFVLAGCGDDDSTADGDETTTTADALAGETAAADQALCDAMVEVDANVNSPEGDPAAAFAAMDEVAANAPADMSDAVDALVADAKAVLPAGGDLSDESQQTMTEVYAHMADTCDIATATITAVDYEFEELPETLDAGPTLFEMVNEGAEAHEMAIVRINDDVTDPIEDIAALPEEEAMSKITMAGGLFAMPGDTGYATATLEPGRYGVLCFLPEGSTPEHMEHMEASGEMPEGQPHFMLGMSGEFEVA
jgi:hypothetical protein